MQDLWNKNTNDFKKVLFDTLLEYKKAKTSILENIQTLDGEITKSMLNAIKTAEAICLSTPENKGTSKQNSIKKEATACIHYWGKHRTIYIETGKQNALDFFKEQEEKAIAFKNKREGKAYETVCSPDGTQSLYTHNTPGEHSYQQLPTTLSISKNFQNLQKVHPLPHSSSQSIATSTATCISTYTNLQWKKRKRKSDERWYEHSERSQGKKSEIPRKRQRPLINQSNNSFEDSILEFKENIISLQTIGVIKPAIHNISSKDIPEDIIQSLAYGHKFIHTPKANDKLLKESFDYFFRSTRIRWVFREEDESQMPLYWLPSSWSPSGNSNNENIELALYNLKSRINTMKYPKHTNPNISKTHLLNLNKLLSDPNLMVITTDKNLGYVITDIDWYEKTCLDHLLSTSYINVTEDFYKDDYGFTTIRNLIDELSETINTFTEQGILSEEEAKWILQEDDFFEPSKFYVLPKIHKQPVKGRPIVPSMTWITFHLSEWIANQLNPLVTNLCQDVLRDSTHLLQKLQEINKLDINFADYTVMSADVEALYPNMDITLGLDLMQQFLENHNWKTPTDRTFLLWAMKFTLTKGYISFKDMIFQQTNGAAMGSPMIPPYANIFMHMVEKDIVMKYTLSTDLLIYKRFLDDIFMIIKRHPDSISNIKNDLNNRFPCIKLTWTSPSHTVDFLDITVWIDLSKSCIQTTIFQKPLNQYSYLPYNSYHTQSMKTGFIKGEAIRYARTCSRKKDYHKMISLFTIRLQRRGYPFNLIQDTLNTVSYSQRNEYLKDKDPKEKNTIPYIFKITYNPQVDHKFLRKQLNSFTKEIAHIPNLPNTLSKKVRICYKTPPTLHSKILKARKEKGF